MTELIRRSRLFIGSYVLLFLLLALRFTTPWLVMACAVLFVIGLVDTIWIVLHISGKTAPEPVTVRDVSDAGPEVAGYLATYLLPFLTVAEPTGRDIAAYVIFLVVTGLIYVRSEMTQINPTLYVLGRKVTKISTSGGWSGYVIARSSIEPGDVVRLIPLNKEVEVEARPKA